jgi:hypothetical protein
MFPSVDRLPSTSSANGSSPSLFGGFSGTTRPSDFPRACMPGFWFVTFSGRPAVPSTTDTCGISRFPRKEFPRMLRVSDCAGSSGGLPIAPPSVWPSASHNSVGTPEGRFRSSMAGLRVPLSTLRLRPRGRRRMTRGQDDWLGLSCATLAFATLCQFSTAHCASDEPPLAAHATIGAWSKGGVPWHRRRGIWGESRTGDPL